jgi:hypothetical protein
MDVLCHKLFHGVIPIDPRAPGFIRDKFESLASLSTSIRFS